MKALLALLVGVGVGGVVSAAVRPLLAAPLFARSNHRGRVIPTGAGVVLALSAMAVGAAAALAAAGGTPDGALSQADAAVLVAAVGFTWLGMLDDLVGSGDDGRGFRAHLSALARGRATTGGLKLVAGGALALVACAPVSGGGAWRLVTDAALVALGANLANQFDRAPGRALKVATLGFLALGVGTGGPDELAGVAVIVGAGLALAPGDLGERFMLGDTGANALGAVLGLGVVVAASPGVRLAVLGGVAALNVAGEVVSFGRVIDRVPLLRAADRAGRRS